MITGALAWLAAPAIPVGDAIELGSLDHGFLFFPLVAAPLAFALATSLLRPEGVARVVHLAARRVQPFAAAAVLVAFLMPRGPVAGALVVPWIAMAVALAIAGIAAARRGEHPHLSRVNLIVAHLFFPIGTVWLLLLRLGTGPAHVPSTTVMLAALHFHFSGFALQMLIAATARRIPTSASGLARLQRVVAIAAIASIPLIAAGNLLQIGVVKTLGVASVVLASAGLAAVSVVVALATAEAIARRLLLASAGSVGAAMLLAGIFRAGEVLGTAWIGIDTMVTTHGLLNALGFVTCGVIAHLRLATQ